MRFLWLMEWSLLLYQIGRACKYYNESACKEYAKKAFRIMISIGARITALLLRIYTYPYRKKHMSLSRTVKVDHKPYDPPKNYRHEIIDANGTAVEVLKPSNQNSAVCIVQFHGGGHTQAMNGMYRKVAERLCKLTECPVYSIFHVLKGVYLIFYIFRCLAIFQVLQCPYIIFKVFQYFSSYFTT